MINRFDMTNSTGQRQTIWFRADVPVRKWNTMCLIRGKVTYFQCFQGGIKPTKTFVKQSFDISLAWSELLHQRLPTQVDGFGSS